MNAHATIQTAYGARTAEQAARAALGQDRLYAMVAAQRDLEACGPALARALTAERATIGRSTSRVAAELDRALRNARAAVSRIEAAIAALPVEG